MTIRAIRSTLGIMRFWVVAFAVILWRVSRGRQWHQVCVDYDCGEDGAGRPVRKQIRARRGEVIEVTVSRYPS